MQQWCASVPRSVSPRPAPLTVPQSVSPRPAPRPRGHLRQHVLPLLLLLAGGGAALAPAAAAAAAPLLPAAQLLFEGDGLPLHLQGGHQQGTQAVCLLIKRGGGSCHSTCRVHRPSAC